MSIRGPQPGEKAAKFFHVSRLRGLRGCEQVAAVCYRMRGEEIEFLLVQTRGRRWIFPKGNAEPGLTHAQAAAMEAFEEAGVHGRMEEAAFTQYIGRKGDTRTSAAIEMAVSAHLCEVTRLDTPQEDYRDPTWFSPAEAKRCLQEERTPNYGVELAKVVTRAVARIRRLRVDTARAVPAKQVRVKHGLQKVFFIDRARVSGR
jgi:8-oxo-dGTP pyrophosphatase MutT (NUDIX family)